MTSLGPALTRSGGLNLVPTKQTRSERTSLVPTKQARSEKPNLMPTNGIRPRELNPRPSRAATQTSGAIYRSDRISVNAALIESLSTLEVIAKKKVSPYQRWRPTPGVYGGRMVSPSPGDSEHFPKGAHRAGVWDPADCTKNVFLEEVVAVKHDVQQEPDAGGSEQYFRHIGGGPFSVLDN
ncbi:hypothetical protein U1Q18_005214 [Sarracenia purpurea var. burkii]